MKYERFENIPVWKQARKFVKEVYLACNSKTFHNDFDLLSQIRRASTSIILNIAEGFERKTNKDFARFINQSKASAGEVRCALYIGYDVGFISKEMFTSFFSEIVSISKQLAKYELYLRRTDHKK